MCSKTPSVVVFMVPLHVSQGSDEPEPKPSSGTHSKVSQECRFLMARPAPQIKHGTVLCQTIGHEPFVGGEIYNASSRILFLTTKKRKYQKKRIENTRMDYTVRISNAL